MASPIEQEIQSLQFPQDVKNMACEVHNMLDLPTVPRKAKRARVKCYCIYQAYNELGKQFIPDPGFIGQQLGLDITDSNRSISKRPKYKQGRIPKPVMRTPQTILKSYIQEYIHLPNDLTDDILSTFDRVIASKPDLLLAKPKPLVAAYIMVHTEFSGINANMADLASALFISVASIHNLLDTLRLCVMEHI